MTESLASEKTAEVDFEAAEPDSDQEGLSYKEYDQLAMPTPTTVARVHQQWLANGTMQKSIRARKTAFVHNLIYLDGKKFDFTGREYLEPVYDRNDRRILLKTARQVEKCGKLGTPVLLEDGSERALEQLQPGDRITAIGADGRQTVDTVLASESNGMKRCLRVRTRLGSVLEVTLNHPVRKLLGWHQAGALCIGDRIAALRSLGQFGAKSEPLAGLLGLMVGDGSMTENCRRFTAKTPEVQEWFLELNGPTTSKIDARSGTSNYYIAQQAPVTEFFRSRGIFGKTASEKELPAECFQYDRTSAQALLRGLWATDGHCKNVTASKVDLIFCTTSAVLARQVRLLLRKFGIVTVQRENQPSNGGQLAYILRVVTRRSIEAFHTQIGPIPGKPFELPACRPNSNLDTLPKEVHELVVAARKAKGTYWQRDGFQSSGHRINRSYAPTFQKIAAQNELLGDETLKAILEADVIWDEVVSLEDIGEQPTWGIQTATETYVSDFVVNHNTTFLANNLTCDSIVIPYNKSLYVSPSHTQTRQFSNEKLRPAIEKSPFVKKYFQDSFVSTQVFEKGFTNGAYIFLRSAFRSADRTRGISARNLCLDEIQDFLGSEIPVIMECTSHFLDARILMAGTPKSFDNPIETYWQETTQNEWLVPCHGCGKWNFLDETNIGPTEWYAEGRLPPGPICKKCHKPINVRDGRWFATSPGKMIVGYRIPQLMVPWICGLYDQWQRLLWKRDNYPLGQFYNEVLGLSYDSASKPITRDELISICSDYNLWDPVNLTPEMMREARGLQLTAGVDWGEGNDGSEKSPSGKIRNASYTVLTIGAYINQRQWAVKLVKKYQGQETDPDFVVKDITRICNALNVRLLGADWGHGWGVNNHLVRLMGANRVAQFQYLPKLKQRMKWDPIGVRFHLQRNFMMSELFYDMKHGHIVFPRWAQIEPYAKDILAIYAEYSEFRREIKYDHRPTDPDDYFHSMHYARLASDVFTGKSRKYTQEVTSPD